MQCDKDFSFYYTGLITTGSAPHSCFYDGNKNFLSSFKQSSGKNNRVTNLPENTKYVRFSIYASDYLPFSYKRFEKESV